MAIDISIENPKKAPESGIDKSFMPPLYSWMNWLVGTGGSGGAGA